jgi:hypothetical protein
MAVAVVVLLANPGTVWVVGWPVRDRIDTVIRTGVPDFDTFLTGFVNVDAPWTLPVSVLTFSYGAGYPFDLAVAAVRAALFLFFLAAVLRAPHRLEPQVRHVWPTAVAVAALLSGLLTPFVVPTPLFALGWHVLLGVVWAAMFALLFALPDVVRGFRTAVWRAMRQLNTGPYDRWSAVVLAVAGGFGILAGYGLLPGVVALVPQTAQSITHVVVAVLLACSVVVLYVGLPVFLFRVLTGKIKSRTIARLTMPPSAEWPRRTDEHEATRALCVAAYQDHRLAEKVAELLMTRDLRAIAPSVGVDLRPVLLHHLAALRHRLLYYSALTVVLAMTVLVSFQSLSAVLLGLLSAAVLVVADDQRRRRVITERLAAGGPLDPSLPVDAVLRERLDAVDRAQRGNVTMFSGFRPFVGYGESLEQWSFALPVRPAGGFDGKSQDTAVEPFTALQLVGHVEQRLLAAGGSPGPVHGLRVEHRLFVNGVALADDPTLRPQPGAEPPTSLDVTEFVGDPVAAPRHYLCAHVVSSGGHIVASVFLRFTTDRRLLHVECEQAVMPPVARRYAPKESPNGRIGGRELGELVLTAPFRGVVDLLSAPFRLVWLVAFRTRCAVAGTQARRQARDERAYDHGAAASARELAADTAFHDQFQQADATRHLRSVERVALEAVTEFLERHNVDTAELRNRQTTILNKGIIQTGGTSNIGVQAVGRGAAATAENVKVEGKHR